MFERPCRGPALIAWMTSASVLTQAPDIERLADSVAEEMLAWQRDIHQLPQLGNREFETSRKVCEHLRSLGIEMRTGRAITGGGITGGAQHRFQPNCGSPAALALARGQNPRPSALQGRHRHTHPA